MSSLLLQKIVQTQNVGDLKLMILTSVFMDSLKKGVERRWQNPCFWLTKRHGKVFVTVVPNCSKEALMPVIQEEILEDSTIHTALMENVRLIDLEQMRYLS